MWRCAGILWACPQRAKVKIRSCDCQTLPAWPVALRIFSFPGRIHRQKGVLKENRRETIMPFHVEFLVFETRSRPAGSGTTSSGARVSVGQIWRVGNDRNQLHTAVGQEKNTPEPRNMGNPTEWFSSGFPSDSIPKGASPMLLPTG